jgi:site-specific DNA-methyltransferase (adenine-specific)
MNQLFLGDCLEIMPRIHTKSIDMILCDLPYGTTHNEWDQRINSSLLWEQYSRIIKDSGCIALFSQSPFDKILACSNLDLYRYEWILEKTKATGHLNAKKMPMKAHENVLIFYKKLPVYNPQKTTGHEPVHTYIKHTGDGSNYGKTKSGISGGGSTERYPRDVLKFKWDTQEVALHPQQKPIAACKYFIETYTNTNYVVLDNCMGSGTTGITCNALKRNFIGIEKNIHIFNLAEKRLEAWREL